MIRCKLLGHVPTRVDTQNFRATCARCRVTLSVSYDMAYGETIVLGEVS